MKNLALYSVTYVLIVSGSLYFPYIQFDVFEYSYGFLGIPNGKELIVSGDILEGYKILPAYAPLAGAIIAAPFVLVKRSLNLANVGKVVGILMVIYMGVLTMALTASPSFYHGYENVELLPGFYISLIATIVYMLVFSLNSAIIKRWPQGDRPKDDDLLDDSWLD